jgi:hypothetical protein
MNERLMKHVERAVRPVRADRNRKLQMREELLAHLTALVDEERQRTGDDEAALAAAAARFGDPAALARELDASVGAWQRYSWREEQFLLWCRDWFVFRPDRSLAGNLARTGVNMVAIVAVLFALLIGLSYLAFPERRGQPDYLPLLIKVAALGAAAACLMLWATQTILHATGGLGWAAALWTVVSRGLVWAVGLVVATSVFWWAVSGRVADVLAVMPQVVFNELVAMPALLVLVWIAERMEQAHWQAHRKWTSLELEE